MVRERSLDLAKGIGILLVVFGHCIGGLIPSGFFPPDELWPDKVLFVIYLFHMPLFFFISGQLAFCQKRSGTAWLRKLILSLFYPYLLWSLLQGSASIAFSAHTNHLITVWDLSRILWIPILQYWFLYSLFLCQLAYRPIRSLGPVTQIAIASAAFLVPILFLGAIHAHRLEIVFQATRAFLFFVAGAVCGSVVKRTGAIVEWAPAALFAAAAFGLLRLQLGEVGYAIASVPAALAAILAILVAARALAARKGALLDLLTFLGQYTMSIFVMHVFFAAAARVALVRLGIGTVGYPGATAIQLTVQTLAGTVLPLGINWLVSRLRADPWFGLQPMLPASSPA